MFKVGDLNKVWAGEITFIKALIGWKYLAVVLDLFHKDIVGWAVVRTYFQSHGPQAKPVENMRPFVIICMHWQCTINII